MSNEIIKGICSIKRHFNDIPTIVSGTIEKGCTFENSMVEGYGTIIIDDVFFDDMLAIIKEKEIPKKFIELLTYINNCVSDYFYSSKASDESREQAYASSHVLDDEGMIIGTKLSSLKGRNVALCSEKSIAANVLLEYLYRTGILTRKPTMILSKLKTENNPSEPHAFVLLDKEQDVYPTRHLLYDVQNPTTIIDDDGNKSVYVGLYTLSDEQYDNLLKGIECTPASLFEVMNGSLHNVSEKRIYGSISLNKAF